MHVPPLGFQSLQLAAEAPALTRCNNRNILRLLGVLETFHSFIKAEHARSSYLKAENVAAAAYSVFLFTRSGAGFSRGSKPPFSYYLQM